jgi:RES domain-containing protein
MKFDRIQPNPRFAELREIIVDHPEWLKPWAGMFFRFQTIDFPIPKDVLSGEGSYKRGGRWNRPGIAAVYGSANDVTALEESKANDRYYGLVTKTPRLVVAIEAQLVGVLDLTTVGIRRSLGVTLNELAGEDWRKLLEAGQESLSQALGRAAAAVGASCLLAKSAVVRQGVNVVVFPKAHRGDRMEVVEGDKLVRLGIRVRA